MDFPSAIESPVQQGAASAQPANGFVRVFNRIFSRHLMNIAILVALPVIFTMSLNRARTSLKDPDIWWHLADARQLMTTHHFIWTEPNSFTVGGKLWVNPEWLSELPFWFGYQALHLRGIYYIEWLIIGGNLVFLYWRACRLSGHKGAAWWATALGFVLASVNTGPRTIAVAYLAMSAELTILETADRGNTRALWLLPPLFAIWINLHGSWLIGLALFVLYILCGSFNFSKGAIDQLGFSAPLRNRLLTVLGISVVALLVNPYGWRLVWNPFDMMAYQKIMIANVMEWKPLNLSTMAGAAGFGAMCLMVVTNALNGRKWRVYELAVVFFAWYAALDHMRFLFMAAVLTTPMLALEFRRGFELESDEKTIPAANAVLVAAAITIMVILFPSEKNLQTKLEGFFPIKSIAAIQPSWRTFNYDPIGGFMTFESKPVFLDSRLDIFEHEGVLADYLQAMYLVSPLEVFDKYHVDHVLVVEHMPDAYLLKRVPGWTLIKREKGEEGIYVTFARTPGVAAGTVSQNADAGLDKK